MTRREFGIAAIVSGSASGDDPQEMARVIASATGRFQNGRSWKALNELVRVGFVLGYMNSERWISEKAEATTFSATDGNEAVEKTLHAALGDGWPPNMNLGEIVASVTKLYEDEPANAAIPIAAIIDVVEMKARGTAHDIVEKRMDENRAYWGNPANYKK